MSASKIFDGVNPRELSKEQLIKEIEEAVKTHEMLRVFMNSVEDGFSILDENFVYIAVNDAILKRTGFKESDFIGRFIGDVAPVILTTGRIETYKRVLRTGIPETIERITSYNEERQLKVFAFKAGEYLGLITRDISDEIYFEETLLDLQGHALKLRECDSLKQIYDVTVDAMTNILSHSACDILMVKDDYLIQVASNNLPMDLKIPLDGKGLTVRAINTMQPVLENDVAENSSYIIAAELPDTKAASGFQISQSELVVPIIVESEAIGVLNIESVAKNAFTSNDRLLLEILAIQVASAIKGVHDLNTQLDLYKQIYDNQSKIEQAEEMSRLKTNFMSSATHEIRTPITSIKGYVDIIMEDLDFIDQKDLMQHLSVIQRNVDRLEHLSNDLLDNMRIEQHRIELNYTEVDFHELVNQTILEIQPILDVRNQRMDYVWRCTDSRVSCDVARLNQVLINIFTNASYYSENGSNIQVECIEVDDQIQVSVADTGIGLSSDDLEKLFTPFPDIQGVKVKRGTGLGLSICQGIIELHGGTIWATSEGLGKGTVVSFRIPKNTEK